VEFLALPSSKRLNFPEMRRRLAAAVYVEREEAKGHDRAQACREAVKKYGPFPSVNFADWYRRKNRREAGLASKPKLDPPPPVDYAQVTCPHCGHQFTRK
jgi:hypothetical protein